jgi:hypothetical protein
VKVFGKGIETDATEIDHRIGPFLETLASALGIPSKWTVSPTGIEGLATARFRLAARTSRTLGKNRTALLYY